jgi:hypothetical protein
MTYMHYESKKCVRDGIIDLKIDLFKDK